MAVGLGFVVRSGVPIIEVRLDGRRVGELTKLMSQRYGPQVDDVLRRGERPGAVALVVNGRRGVEMELRLPDAPADAPVPVPPPRPRPSRPAPPTPGPGNGRPPRTGRSRTPYLLSIGGRPACVALVAYGPHGLEMELRLPDVTTEATTALSVLPAEPLEPEPRNRTPYLIGASVLALLLAVGVAVGAGPGERPSPSRPTVVAAPPPTSAAPEPTAVPLAPPTPEDADAAETVARRAPAQPPAPTTPPPPEAVARAGRRRARAATCRRRHHHHHGLVAEGIVALDDPVDGFLPELADRRVLTSIGAELDDTVPAVRPITVRDLLTFRMGMGLVLAPPGTSDQLEPGQADGIFLSGGYGWGFGVAVDAARGRYGWDGGLGTSWYSGPDVTGILLTQVAWTMGPPAVRGDFWAALGNDGKIEQPWCPVHAGVAAMSANTIGSAPNDALTTKCATTSDGSLRTRR